MAAIPLESTTVRASGCGRLANLKRSKAIRLPEALSHANKECCGKHCPTAQSEENSDGANRTTEYAGDPTDEKSAMLPQTCKSMPIARK